MMIIYVLFWIFGNCKVLNTTILNIVARCLNILIFLRFGNNNIVTYYLIFFLYLFKLVIFLRNITRKTTIN